MTQYEQEIYYAALQPYLETFEGERFHEHYFIMAYLVDLLNKDIRYLEVGLWDGASFCYMIQNPRVTDAVGIDIKMRKQFYENLEKYNNIDCKIIEKSSTDKSILNDISGLFDIIFIDGSHNYFDVIKDYTFYKELVASGGYLIFDDYMDKYSPDVKRAIDYMRNIDNFRGFEIIGSLEQHIPIYYDYRMINGKVDKIYVSLGTLNNFILRKL
jgi:predicted O-methyltransferase YrrM